MGWRSALPFWLTLLLTPLAWRLAHRLGVVDHPREHKFHREATPYLGGLAVALGVLAVAAVTAGTASQVLTILAGGLAATVLGLVDDWRGVGPLVKLLVEASIGVALWMAGVRAGLFGIEALDLILTVVWVVAITNAMNLLDNMDGIAAGVAAVCAARLLRHRRHARRLSRRILGRRRRRRKPRIPPVQLPSRAHLPRGRGLAVAGVPPRGTRVEARPHRAVRQRFARRSPFSSSPSRSST